MAFCIVYNRKVLRLCTVGSGFYCFCAGAAVGIPADAIPVETSPADVTNQNRSAAADRRTDADVIPQNRPALLRQDLRDLLMKTADGNG